jgi:hypothetical protein
MESACVETPQYQLRRRFIGGSDARIIMGNDEAALLRLWQEKRGEVEPEDLSGNLIVQLGVATEEPNRRWFELNTSQSVKDIQRRAVHPLIRWMAATIDGVVEATGAVFEAKFMLPWSFSEEGAVAKHMAQLQHNMRVIGAADAALSIIMGSGHWLGIKVAADPLYQQQERNFWRFGHHRRAPTPLFGRATPEVFQRRTPGPSSGVPMNSMPAASNARWRSTRVWERLGGIPSCCSSRSIVRLAIPVLSAATAADQRSAPRAALIWVPVITI